MNYHQIGLFHEPISSWTHFLTAFLFLIFGSAMIYKARGNKARTLSLGIYVFCGVFLFSMSAVYHLLEKGSVANYVLRILDHAGIYLMIAGTFTPYHILLFRGLKRWVPLLLIWLLAVTGISLTAVFFHQIPELLTLGIFLGMGWLSLFLIYWLYPLKLYITKYIVLGGAIYTIGAVMEFLQWPIIFSGYLHAHESFHIFVSFAAGIHFRGVWILSKKAIAYELELVIQQYTNHINILGVNEKISLHAENWKTGKIELSTWIHNNYLRHNLPKKVLVTHNEVLPITEGDSSSLKSIKDTLSN